MRQPQRKGRGQGDGHGRVREGIPQGVEEASIGQQLEIVAEPDENGFVEESVRLQAEVEPLDDGNQPENDQYGEERGQQEDR
jgi:hypothetical protein